MVEGRAWCWLLALVGAGRRSRLRRHLVGRPFGPGPPGGLAPHPRGPRHGPGGADLREPAMLPSGPPRVASAPNGDRSGKGDRGPWPADTPCRPSGAAGRGELATGGLPGARPGDGCTAVRAAGVSGHRERSACRHATVRQRGTWWCRWRARGRDAGGCARALRGPAQGGREAWGALRTIPEDLRDLPLARVRQGHLMELARVRVAQSTAAVTAEASRPERPEASAPRGAIAGRGAAWCPRRNRRRSSLGRG